MVRKRSHMNCSLYISFSSLSSAGTILGVCESLTQCSDDDADETLSHVLKLNDHENVIIFNARCACRVVFEWKISYALANWRQFERHTNHMIFETAKRWIYLKAFLAKPIERIVFLIFAFDTRPVVGAAQLRIGRCIRFLRISIVGQYFEFVRTAAAEYSSCYHFHNVL